MDSESNKESSSNRKVLIIVGCVLAIVVLCLIVVFTLFVIYYLLNSESSSGTGIDGELNPNDYYDRPHVEDGMKKLYFNHLKFDKESNKLISAEASILYTEEENSHFNLSPSYSSDDEIYFVTEDNLDLSCKVTCTCEGEASYDGDDYERRVMSKTMIRIVVATIVISFLAISIVGCFADDCESQCNDAGLTYSGVEDYECEPSEKPDNWPID